MSARTIELELRRRLLIERSDWQRERLRTDCKVAGNWLRMARIIGWAARRATRLYRYWHHAAKS